MENGGENKSENNENVENIDPNFSILKVVKEDILSKWKDSEDVKYVFPYCIIYFYSFKNSEEKSQNLESVDNCIRIPFFDPRNFVQDNPKRRILYADGCCSHIKFPHEIELYLRSGSKIVNDKIEPLSKEELVDRCLNIIHKIKKCESCNQSQYLEKGSVCNRCMHYRVTQKIDELCCICKDENFLGVYYYLPCGHSFHFSCVRKILKKECPMCRKVFEFDPIHLESDCVCNECDSGD